VVPLPIGNEENIGVLKMSVSVENERDRLGRLVRGLWIEWAARQPNPKPSWLVEYDGLSEADKEADRVIGYGLLCEFNAQVTGERLERERLKQVVEELKGLLSDVIQNDEMQEGFNAANLGEDLRQKIRDSIAVADQTFAESDHLQLFLTWHPSSVAEKWPEGSVVLMRMQMTNGRDQYQVDNHFRPDWIHRYDKSRQFGVSAVDWAMVQKAEW
jgi:hypothetical protein